MCFPSLLSLSAIFEPYGVCYHPCIVGTTWQVQPMMRNFEPRPHRCPRPAGDISPGFRYLACLFVFVCFQNSSESKTHQICEDIVYYSL